MSMRSLGGAYREIFTKAVCARGKESFRQTHSFKPTHEPERILGCWVANHRCMARPTSESVVVDGQYDVNLWYSFSGNSQTEIVKGTICYTEQVPVDSIGGDKFGPDAEVRATVVQEPHCITRTLKQGDESSGAIIQVEVEYEFYSEVVAETKLVVRAVPAGLLLDPGNKKDDAEWDMDSDELVDDFTEDDMGDDDADVNVG